MAKTSHLSIKYLPTDSLIQYARNSRTHTEDQIGRIASSIREFGFTNPILVDEEGGIIAGHGRVRAAIKLNLKECPTITLSGLTEAQKRAYVIADNQLAINGSGWDFEMLAVELDDLMDAGFDLSLLGFDKKELDGLLGSPDEPQDKQEEGEGNYQEQYGVIVVCKDAGHQEYVFNQLSELGHECKVVCT